MKAEGALKILSVLLVGTLCSCGRAPSFDLYSEQASFAQSLTYNNKIDVLWVVDNTATMESHRQNVANQFDSFIDLFVSKGMDFNLAITTTDMRIAKGPEGAFIGSPRVISSGMGSAPKIKEMFRKNMSVAQSDSAQEEGMRAMKTALSPDLLTTLNSGFLRTDAVLVVVFLTDENDHSVPGELQGYVEFLDKLKPRFKFGSRGWVANLVGITDSDGLCRTGNGVPEKSIKYIDLAKYSGGTIESVCSPQLSQSLKKIQARVAEMITEYKLNREPIEETIVVTIDGSRLERNENNGWTYHAEETLIRFHGTGIPSAKSVVQVDYKPKFAKEN